MSSWNYPYTERHYAAQPFLRRLAILLLSDDVMYWANGKPRYAFYKGIRYSFERLPSPPVGAS